MVYNPAVPVSEVKLKIKKFQNWLAGNHHKDIEKRLRHDKDGAKQEQARIRSRNKLLTSSRSRRDPRGGVRARTQVGAARTTNKVRASTSW